MAFQSVASPRAREKDVEVLRLFVRYIDITQHLLVYRHIILSWCCSPITPLYTQSSKTFCLVCLINLQKDVKKMSKARSLLLL